MRRYLLGRVAVAVTALYLLYVAVSAVVTVLTRDVGHAWLAVTGTSLRYGAEAEINADWFHGEGGGELRALMYPPAHGADAALIVPGLVLVCWLMAWSTWQILRGPAAPAGPAAPQPRRVVWWRRLVYFHIAFALVLPAFEDDFAYLLGYLLSNTPLMVLFCLVMAWRGRWLRALALTFAVLDAADTVLLAAGEVAGDFWPAYDLVSELLSDLGLPALAWQAAILLGQRHDPRWSATTVRIGWWSLGSTLALTVARTLVGVLAGGQIVALALLDGLWVLYLVWLARSAYETIRPYEEAGRAVRRGPSPLARTAAATCALVPLFGLVQPEETPRLTFDRWRDECLEERRFADTPPRHRERVFLCGTIDVWRTGVDGFPDHLPDQYLLGYGRELCATPDRAGQDALLRRVGATTSMDRLYDDLVFLCPEVVGRVHPELLRSEAEERRSVTDYYTKVGSQCSDPWPALRGVRQRTVAYWLSEGGGYAIYDPDTEDEESPDPGRGFVGAAGDTVFVHTYGENEPICLTAKALRFTPPLRLKGWEQVEEVGVGSRGGKLELPVYYEGSEYDDLQPTLPDLAAAGPGRYRVRVYIRVRDAEGLAEDAPWEEHLVLVFPGRSAEKVVHAHSEEYG